MMFLKTVICTVMQIMHNLYKYSTHACFSQTYMCTGTHVHHDAYILYYIVLDVNRICIPPLPEDIRTRVPWY